MDSFEFNKYAGWGLAAVLSLLTINTAVSSIFTPVKPERASYVIEGVIAEASAAGPVEAEKPIAFYLASATADKGEAIFKKCAACHSIAKGGANGIGPNLYGIVGDPINHMPGYAYSDALTAMKGKAWTWDELSSWLKSPKTYAAGTKMAFAGIAKPEDRAALLMYLAKMDDSPEAVPAAPAEAAPAEAAAPADPATAPAAAPVAG